MSSVFWRGFRSAIKLLGLKVEDKITGFIGIVTSVSFDLYGCIQVVVTSGDVKGGKDPGSLSRFIDVERVRILDEKPVVELPKF